MPERGACVCPRVRNSDHAFPCTPAPHVSPEASGVLWGCWGTGPRAAHRASKNKTDPRTLVVCAHGTSEAGFGLDLGSFVL